MFSGGFGMETNGGGLMFRCDLRGGV
jgi:hypothetical protein